MDDHPSAPSWAFGAPGEFDELPELDSGGITSFPDGLDPWGTLDVYAALGESRTPATTAAGGGVDLSSALHRPLDDATMTERIETFGLAGRTRSLSDFLLTEPGSDMASSSTHNDSAGESYNAPAAASNAAVGTRTTWFPQPLVTTANVAPSQRRESVGAPAQPTPAEHERRSREDDAADSDWSASDRGGDGDVLPGRRRSARRAVRGRRRGGAGRWPTSGESFARKEHMTGNESETHSTTSYSLEAEAAILVAARHDDAPGRSRSDGGQFGGSGNGASAKSRNSEQYGSPAPVIAPETALTTTGRKPRFLWTEELHRRFVAAVFDFGARNATPKALHERKCAAVASV